MTINDQRLLAALLRSSLSHFVRKAFATVSPGEVFLPNWHLEALCYHLELVRAGKIIVRWRGQGDDPQPCKQG